MHRFTRRGFLAGGVALAASSVPWPVLARPTSPPALPQTIRVHLFSGQSVTRVDIAGTAPLQISIGSNTRPASTLTFDALSGALTADGANLNAGGAPIGVSSTAPLTVTATVSSVPIAPRHYNGSISLQRIGSSLLVVNAVDVDSYVTSTLVSEISPGWPPESMKAQAIVARTYALRAAQHSATKPYDVTDDTSNQVYRGIDGITPSFSTAAGATTGMTLMAGGAPAEVFYHAVCGGHTAASIQITGRPGPSYLGGIADVDDSGRPYCTPAPFFAWQNTVTAESMSRVVGDLSDIIVTDRWIDGRAKTVRIARPGAPAYDIDGQHFYMQCSSVLGYKVVPSAMFDVLPGIEGYTFTGHGLGHGVGMCQWGAKGRANAGQLTAQILAAYFPGTTLVNPTLR